MSEYPPNLASPPLDLSLQIEDTERDIKRLDETIATLTANGQETIDATRHLKQLLDRFTTLVRFRMKVR